VCKSLLYDQTSIPTEKITTDQETGETYVAIIAKDAGSLVDIDSYHADPSMPASSTRDHTKDGKKTLNFIPFYFRANRGGKGHMRVGLRVLT
jgi:hypothetical protein